jgi:hypothetical protein
MNFSQYTNTSLKASECKYYWITTLWKFPSFQPKYQCSTLEDNVIHSWRRQKSFAHAGNRTPDGLAQSLHSMAWPVYLHPRQVSQWPTLTEIMNLKNHNCLLNFIIFCSLLWNLLSTENHIFFILDIQVALTLLLLWAVAPLAPSYCPSYISDYADNAIPALTGKHVIMKMGESRYML